MKSKIALFLSILFTTSCATAQKTTEPLVKFETSYGNFTVKLYAKTPAHRDNFMKLVDDGFYKDVLFHRVIADFMVQAGDPKSKTADAQTALGSGDVGYKVPAEIIYPTYYHKRGALSAARQGDNVNPSKASSGCQFYIVQGRTYTDAELDNMEQSNKQKLLGKHFQEIVASKQEAVKQYQQQGNQLKLNQLRDSILAEANKVIESKTNYKYTPQQRIDYRTVGGTPHLDMDYTVFGEITQGLEVIDKISKTKTGANDRPLEDIRIISAVRINL